MLQESGLGKASCPWQARKGSSVFVTGFVGVSAPLQAEGSPRAVSADIELGLAMSGIQSEFFGVKLVPQPHERAALGFSKAKPPDIRLPE